jgi:hypothetical protein
VGPATKLLGSTSILYENRLVDVMSLIAAKRPSVEQVFSLIWTEISKKRFREYSVVSFQPVSWSMAGGEGDFVFDACFTYRIASV